MWSSKLFKVVFIALFTVLLFIGSTTSTRDHLARARNHRRPEIIEWAREDLNFRPHAYQACAIAS